MVKTLKALLVKITARYQVAVTYEASAHQWVSKIHYARNWEDALEWASCYDVADHVRVYESMLGMRADKSMACRIEAY